VTDFGRRVLGLGDMLKSVYDPDLDEVIALAQTEADMTKAVYDPTLAALAALLAAHKTQHQGGGTDQISVTGLAGTTPRAILGDGTAGRVFRGVVVKFQDGTNSDTIKITVVSRWNGDAIAEQDNIAKNATTGHFKLSSDGKVLVLLNTGLTGSVLYVISNLISNATTNEFLSNASKVDDGIQMLFQGLSDGANKDITGFINAGDFYTHLLYITDA